MKFDVKQVEFLVITTVLRCETHTNTDLGFYCCVIYIYVVYTMASSIFSSSDY